MNSVKNHIQTENWIQVTDKLWKQVSIQVDDQVGSQVRSHIVHRVWHQVRDQLNE